MSEASPFNLIDEPWIEVRLLDGTMSCESLSSIFEHSSQIRNISGELPTQAFAILRVLLAILQRAILTAEDFDEQARTANVWGELWRANDLPLDKLNRYLAEWHDRFNLFSEEKPFMQVARIPTPQNGTWPIRKIIADIPDRFQFYTMRTGRGASAITYAEAARWLIHVHAFDTSGFKHKTHESQRVARNGLVGSVSPGWATKIGCVYFEGNNLRETLLLNLVLGNIGSPSYFIPTQDLPAWERPQNLAFGVVRQPDGFADIYTWQSRRVLLVPDRDRDNVVRVILGYGDTFTTKVEGHDPLSPANLHGVEPMSAWKRIQNQKRKATNAQILPADHEKNRALWRGLSSLLPSSERDGGANLIPGIVSWVRYLTSDDGRNQIPEDMAIRMRACAVFLDGNKTKTKEVMDDRISFSSSLLLEDNLYLVDAAQECVSCTERAIQALGFLARDIYTATGGRRDPNRGMGRRDSSDGAYDSATEWAYFTLDAPFRKWLAELSPEGATPDERDNYALGTRKKWVETAHRIIHHIGEQLVSDANPQAFIGHPTESGHMTIGKAYQRFSWALNKALPLADGHPQASTFDDKE